jgi:hypothetical protein
MPKEAQRDVSAQVRGLGMASSGVARQRARLEASRDKPGVKATSRNKASQRLSSLAALEPHLEDRPITLQGAAGHRQRLVQQGARRTMREGTESGHNWYFQHHGRLADVAQATGHDKHRVIAASAVMSPQNNPEQELTAVYNLAQAHRPTSSIHISKEAARKDRSLADWAGREVHPSKLTASQLAAASTPGVREHITTRGFDLGGVAKGGTKDNVSRAINVLRGHTPVSQAIDPHTSPKVWSYHENIAKSVPGTGEQVEFHRRMGAATGLLHHDQLKGQQALDLYPQLRGATHGPLNPTGTTAEDTWQQAISTRQRLPVVDVPGRTGRAARQSPAKFSVGEGGEANQKFLRTPTGMSGVGPSAAMHAWQNEATIRAARSLSRRSGEIVPATGVQAGGWTEARRHAGKAIEEAEVTRRKPKQPVQHSLF